MRIQLRINSFVREYNGDLDYQRICHFVSEEFGLNGKHFSISKTSFEECQKIKSLQKLCKNGIAMTLDIEVEWDAIADEEISDSTLRYLLCQKADGLSWYCRKNTQALFEIAKDSGEKFFKYPFFEVYNRYNYQLAKNGAMGILAKLNDLEYKVIAAHLLQLCGLQNQKYPYTFLNELLTTPCDMEECRHWIFSENKWEKVASNSAWLNKLKESFTHPNHAGTK